jgi:hypothetical protein
MSDPFAAFATDKSSTNTSRRVTRGRGDTWAKKYGYVILIIVLLVVGVTIGALVATDTFKKDADGGGGAIVAPSPPRSVQNTPGNGSITVQFAPPSSDGGSSISTFTVSVVPVDVLPTQGVSSPIKVTGLTNGTQYAVTVTATNQDNLTSDTSEAVFETPSSNITITVPDAPTNVVGVSGDATVSVDFVSPVKNGNALITEFTVTDAPDGKTAQGANPTLTVVGLTNGTAYTFTVTATNSAGTGVTSAPSEPVTPVANAPTPTQPPTPLPPTPTPIPLGAVFENDVVRLRNAVNEQFMVEFAFSNQDCIVQLSESRNGNDFLQKPIEFVVENLTTLVNGTHMFSSLRVNEAGSKPLLEGRISPCVGGYPQIPGYI